MDGPFLHSSTDPSRKKLPSIDPQFTRPVSLSFFVNPLSDSLVTTSLPFYVCFFRLSFYVRLSKCQNSILGSQNLCIALYWRESGKICLWSLLHGSVLLI